MKVIPLTKGMETIVSDEDYEKLSKHNWYCNSHGYAVRQIKEKPGKQTTISMHREILNVPKGIQVDHINRNPLDNQRCNLRLATRNQNMHNRVKQVNNTSGYKGVSWKKANQKWQSLIRFNHKNVYLGLFDTAEKAFEVYCKAAIDLHKDFANLGDKK